MKIKKLIILIFLFLISSNLSAAEKKYEFLKSKTQLKNALDMRDPFKRKIIRKKNVAIQEKNASGFYTDEVTFEREPIENLRLVGVLLGAERRAMFRLATKKDGEIFYLREGSKVGPNLAELKAILPAGVVLVEKIRNVYDQDEYLETIIPLTSD